ncbi:MAG: hypothetical protein IIZ32_10020, partial [Ruminococcus sp.]|nr:hypothetical protein [Ruminococcus sp.]
RNNGDSMTIRPWYSNFTIADRGTGDNSLILQRNVTFCTDDESGTGRTITIDAKTRGQYTPVLTVSGSGTLQVNGTYTNRDPYPPITVTDTATLAFGAGASLGTGAITLGAGTTLTLSSTGNMFTPIANTLNLPTGENEVATIRIDGTRLRGGEHVLCTLESVPQNVADHVSVTGTALDGRTYTVKTVEVAENETTVTKLVLNITPSGLMLIFK